MKTLVFEHHLRRYLSEITGNPFKYVRRYSYLFVRGLWQGCLGLGYAMFVPVKHYRHTGPDEFEEIDLHTEYRQYEISRKPFC